MRSAGLKRVLVANRGEIAVRVIRACRECGLEAVAVYSEVDRGALHVRLADAAVALPGRHATETYLRGELLLEAARRTGCDAVHPGYGFLSENAAFAEACEQAGLVFVGPGAAAMRLMGDKLAARREASAAGVPVVEGGLEPVRSLAELQARAAEIGFPLLLKAAGGGGGKGIRVVREPQALAEAFARARGEAQSAFGDPTVYVERFVPAARHVEVQVLADAHGAVVHLGERECSLQRRNQKLLEETPSPAISPELRSRLCEAAVALARRIGYRSAGTVEFLVEDAGGPGERFYFMEMNTRLQVEHPVTEMVTGIDLVQEQLRIAAGEPLGYDQEAVRFRGAAIEVRLYAEDPARGFLPSTGRIAALELPQGPWTRVDTALCLGDVVSPYYDPLLAKLTVWGPDRQAAVARLARALDETRIVGVTTTAELLRRLVREPAFLQGQFDTGFLEPFARRVTAASPSQDELERIAVAAALWRAARQRRQAALPAAGTPADGSTGRPSPWAQAGRVLQLGPGWR